MRPMHRIGTVDTESNSRQEPSRHMPTHPQALRSHLRRISYWCLLLALFLCATRASAIVITNQFVDPCFNTFVPNGGGGNKCFMGAVTFKSDIVVGYPTPGTPSSPSLYGTGSLLVNGGSRLRAGKLQIGGMISAGTTTVSNIGSQLEVDELLVGGGQMENKGSLFIQSDATLLSGKTTVFENGVLSVDSRGVLRSNSLHATGGWVTIVGDGSVSASGLYVSQGGMVSASEGTTPSIDAQSVRDGSASFAQGASIIGGGLVVENQGVVTASGGSSMRFDKVTVDSASLSVTDGATLTGNQSDPSLLIRSGTVTVAGSGSQIVAWTMNVMGRPEFPELLSTLSIEDGAIVEINTQGAQYVPSILVGGVGTGSVRIQGAGSRLSILNSDLALGGSGSTAATLRIENGASLTFSSMVPLPTFPEGTGIIVGVLRSPGAVLVSGANSYMSMVGGFLNVGSRSDGSFEVRSGGEVSITSMDLNLASMILGDGLQDTANPVRAKGMLLVHGNGSKLSVSGRDVKVGVNSGDGYLNVESGGRLNFSGREILLGLSDGRGYLNIVSGGKLVAEGENIRLGIGQYSGSAWASVINSSVEVTGDASLLDVGMGEMSFGALALADSATMVLTGSSATMGIGRFGGEGFLSIETGATLALRGDLATLSVGMAGGVGSARVDGLRSNITVDGRGAYIFVGDREGRGVSTLDVVGATVKISGDGAGMAVGVGKGSGKATFTAGAQLDLEVSGIDTGLGIGAEEGIGTAIVSGVGTRIGVIGDGADVIVGLLNGEGLLSIDGGAEMQIAAKSATGRAALAIGMNDGIGRASVVGRDTTLLVGQSPSERSFIVVGTGGTLTVDQSATVTLVGDPNGSPDAVSVSPSVNRSGGIVTIGSTLSAATFAQGGGTFNIANTLSIQYLGRYKLDGGVLQVGAETLIAESRFSSFVQTGGRHIVETLKVGGVYELTGGQLSVLGDEIIGSTRESPQFLQSGNSTHEIGGVLYLGGKPELPNVIVADFSDPLYVSTTVRGGSRLDFYGRTLESGATVIQAGAVLSQSAGLHKTSVLAVAGTYTIQSTIQPSVRLLQVERGEYIFGTLLQTGGQHIVGGEESLDGFLTVAGGNLTVAGPTPMLQINGDLSIRGNDTIAGATGRVRQTGVATVSVARDLRIGVDVPGQSQMQQFGSYDLAGTDLAPTSPLLDSGGSTLLRVGRRAYVGDTDVGTFTQRGRQSEVRIGDSLTIGNTRDSRGTYELYSGVLSVENRTVVGESGTGIFQQFDGVHTVSDLVVAGSPFANGRYELSSGVIRADSISNSGEFVFSGGEIVANVQNRGKLNVVAGASKTIVGDVTNDGELSVVNTSIEYAGLFTNNGSYSSDPSVNRFIDLAVGPAGYLQGGAGDRFIISGNFLNASLEGGLWNTREASLVVTGTGDHTISLASQDYGADGAAFDFEWGELSIEAGVQLRLVDGNEARGAALYIKRLVLQGDVDPSRFISSPFNIYYSRDLDSNTYLNGESFALDGGGWLKPYSPAAVPEPTATWLMLFGMAGVGALVLRKSTSIVH